MIQPFFDTLCSIQSSPWHALCLIVCCFFVQVCTNQTVIFQPNIKPVFKVFDVFSIAYIFHTYGIMDHFQCVNLAFTEAFLTVKCPLTVKMDPVKINLKVPDHVFQIPDVKPYCRTNLDSKYIKWSSV